MTGTLLALIAGCAAAVVAPHVARSHVETLRVIGDFALVVMWIFVAILAGISLTSYAPA